MKYFIKDNYTHRDDVEFFDDTPNTDRFQNKIYEYSKELFIEEKYTSVLDIGCGSGFKLMKNFSEFTTAGVDLIQTVDFLKDKYPEGTWIVDDIEKVNCSINEKYDLVLAIDIIEHLRDPDTLLKYIKCIEFETCIISTPERDIVRGASDTGPPANPYHLREWNSQEFINYISTVFNVIDHLVVSKHEQFVVCCKK